MKHLANNYVTCIHILHKSDRSVFGMYTTYLKIMVNAPFVCGGLCWVLVVWFLVSLIVKQSSYLERETDRQTDRQRALSCAGAIYTQRIDLSAKAHMHHN